MILFFLLQLQSRYFVVVLIFFIFILIFPSNVSLTHVAAAVAFLAALFLCCFYVIFMLFSFYSHSALVLVYCSRHILVKRFPNQTKKIKRKENL